MKVYIVTKEPFPNGMAPTSRIKCYARAIKEGGMDCEVVVCGCTELDKNKIKNTIPQGVYKNVPFRYIGGTTTDTRSQYIRRAAQYIRLLKAEAFLKKNLKSGDVLFLFMGGKVGQMLRFMRIAHNKGAFCVRDLCELPYGTGEETETAIRLRKVTIESQFPKLDGIISISDTLLNLARTYSLPKCKHIKVPIMVDYEDCQLSNRVDEAEVPFIFHSGTLYEQKDGILGMIEAFGIASQTLEFPVKFISTGYLDKSKHEVEIRKLIEKYHLEDKLFFTGFISSDELKDYLSKSSMVIINKYKTQQNNYCFSTKLGEYLAAAKPVIITSVGEAMNWLENEKSAFVIEPRNTEALADAIVHVFKSPEESRRIGLVGKEVCRNSFDYRNWSKPLVDFMNQLGE